MKILSYLNRPEYWFRPVQIYHRIAQNQPPTDVDFVQVQLPWGLPIKIRPDEDLGRAIWSMGIYDLSVTEVIWRLINPGDIVLDIGANIGYMSSIMAQRVGTTGKVICFEPHPEIYQELSANIQIWEKQFNYDQIQPYQIALSNQAGTGILSTSNSFNSNRGTASLISQAESSTNTATQHYTVTLDTLDHLLVSTPAISLAKIDVEGHEISVLEGAKILLKDHKIQNIIFEEHQGYPSPVTQLLESTGYQIFRLTKGFFKPILDSPTQPLPDYSPFWEPPSYLATLNPSPVLSKLEKRGWKSLKS